MINGIINIYKEKGFTSHDVVAKMRGICGQKKIGHTGTLDPAAEGVLPVCLGSATKVCELLQDKSKEYTAVLHLGVTTDTEDMTGEILTENVVNCTVEEIIECINSFTGDYAQIPPMYSALKVNGKKLYTLARAGEVIERKSRNVRIEKITILEINVPLVKIHVECSKGTYIRSLCRDIGEKLNCGGCMESLLRTRVGIFTIDKTYSLSDLQRLKEDNALMNIVIPVDSMFSHLPAVNVPECEEARVKNGNKWKSSEVVNGEVRVYSKKQFYGIYRYDETEICYKPVKMFLSGE